MAFPEVSRGSSENSEELSVQEQLLQHTWNFFPVSERNNPFAKILSRAERLADGTVIYAHVGERGRGRPMKEARKWVIGCIDMGNQQHEVEFRLSKHSEDELVARVVLQDEDSAATIAEAFSSFYAQFDAEAAYYGPLFDVRDF